MTKRKKSDNSTGIIITYTDGEKGTEKTKNVITKNSGCLCCVSCNDEHKKKRTENSQQVITNNN